METIAVIGTGPGDRDYITGIGLKKIEEAEVLVGGKRHLEEFALPHQEKFAITKNLGAALQFIKEKSKTKKVSVLVSGDTGVFSFSSYLKKEFPLGKLEFYPGISSLQLMFARLKMSWQDACFMSFHGEPPCGVEGMIMSGKTVALLTGKIYTPQKIAQYFIDKGVSKNIKAAVGADLSYPNERLFKGTIGELSKLDENYLNSVVVIYHE